MSSKLELFSGGGGAKLRGGGFFLKKIESEQ